MNPSDLPWRNEAMKSANTRSQTSLLTGHPCSADRQPNAGSRMLEELKTEEHDERSWALRIDDTGRNPTSEVATGGVGQERGNWCIYCSTEHRADYRWYATPAATGTCNKVLGRKSTMDRIASHNDTSDCGGPVKAATEHSRL